MTGQAVECMYGGTTTLQYCDIYRSSGGNWVGCISEQAGAGGNIAREPMFCGPELEDLTIDAASWCAPANNECGVPIGAFDVNCGSTPVEISSCGAVKAMFR